MLEKKEKINPPIMLAAEVYGHIKKSGKDLRGTTIEILERFFETLYYTSMHTEEGQLIQVTVSFFDPESVWQGQDPNASADTWSFTPFTVPKTFDIRTMVKLAKAADPWSSSIAVFFDKENDLMIYGLIDQTLHNQMFFNHETQTKYSSAGFFQAGIQGIGHIAVTDGSTIVQVLRKKGLENTFHDVFKKGQVNELVKVKAKYFLDHTSQFLNDRYSALKIQNFEKMIFGIWKETLSRILIQITKYGHGGALLITPKTKGLDINYSIVYNRLRNAINRSIQVNIQLQMMHKILEDEDGKITVSGLKSIQVKEEIKKQIDNELKGAIRFIASQSCVDGIVVLNDDLSTFGFGGVIENVDPPKIVHVAKAATFNKSDELDPKNLGTRHRSMMTFCNNNPGSLGIVISQDGDLRVMTEVEGKLVMWENIKMQKYLKAKVLS